MIEQFNCWNLRRNGLLLVLVFLPLLFGSFFYLAGDRGYANSFVRNFLPDFFWAFSLGFFLLWVWQGSVPWFWWLASASAGCLFELCQGYGWMAGTGDVLDVILYVLGLLCARWVGLLINGFFILYKQDYDEKTFD